MIKSKYSVISYKKRETVQNRDFSIKDVFYLIFLSITPNLCITKMHTDVPVSKEQKSKNYSKRTKVQNRDIY
jgi:hypothetical protein